MSAQLVANSIWEIGTFDARKVSELAARSARSDRRAVPASEAGDVRIHLASSEAAWLMQTIVGLGRLDAALGEADGHSFVDIRNGDGVMAEVVELVAAAIAEHHVTFATVCVGKRTLSFYPAPPGGARPLAA